MRHRLCGIILALNCFALTGMEINWSKARTVHPGIELIQLESTLPRLQKINLMRIDLQNKALRFTGTPRDPDWGKPMPDYDKLKIHTRRVRTRDFMLHARKPQDQNGPGLNMIVAINAAPWIPWEKPFDHKYAHPIGVNISDGQVISDSTAPRAAFVVYKDGNADIVPSIPKTDYPKINLAASGFFLILQDGNFVEDNYSSNPQPRTAYGLSRDRRYLYLMTIDGRQKDWSLGATIRETAELLKDAGSHNAINMDGGGSATLCYWDAEQKKPVVLNRHSKDSYERPVGSSIGICLDK